MRLIMWEPCNEADDVGAASDSDTGNKGKRATPCCRPLCLETPTHMTLGEDLLLLGFSFPIEGISKVPLGF